MPQDQGVLSGAVVLVTGANGGIGQATCVALGKAGAQVVGTDVTTGSRYEAHLWMEQDVTRRDDWQHVVQEVELRFGRLDCIVNNAAVSLVEKIESTSIDQWRRVIAVNVEGALLGMQVCLPLLCKSGCERTGGSAVVNISSTAGLRGLALNAAYCASKGALALLSRTAAKEFAALGYPIRVNSVHPGAVETQMMDGILARYVDSGFSRSIEDQKKAFQELAPLRRLADPHEIAGGVVFLCSPAASYVTGSELVIDGGAIA